MKSAQEYVIDSSLTRIPTLRELAAFSLTGSPGSDLAPNERARQQALSQLVDRGQRRGAAPAGEDRSTWSTRARQFADMDFSFLYNSTTNLLAIGYNVSERRLDASCYDLLASEVRLASFVGIAQGQFPQEHWFALGPPAVHRRRRAAAAVVERLDVRVPDAAAGHADLPEHPARPDLPRHHQGADRLLAPARRAVGDFRVRLQHRRRQPELPVPRVRRAGHRHEARPGRRPGGRAVRHHAGPDGRRRRLVREPAAHARPRLHGQVRLLRSDRLHHRAPAARPGLRGDPLVHGAPPGHGLPGAVLPAARPADAAPLRIRPAVPGHHAGAAGARAESGRLPFAHRRPGRDARAGVRSVDADAHHHRRLHRAAGSAAAVERPLPRDGHLRRRQLQPLEGPGGDALARRRHRRQLGQFLLRARRRQRPVLVDHVPADPGRAEEIRSHLLRRARRIPPPRPRPRPVHRDRRLARRRHRNAPHPHHQQVVGAPHDRVHQLRRSGDGAGRRRCRAPGVFQAVRADRNPAQRERHPVHPPSAHQGRAHAVAAEPDDGA